MVGEAAIDRLVQETHDHCAKYLRERGRDPEAIIRHVARRVVWARYYEGSDGWDRLKEAIGELEDAVGRPTSEAEI